jgi:sterol desaturase/sphingolipid hydroxylase (fatty acid hydroxylase superfamily)
VELIVRRAPLAWNALLYPLIVGGAGALMVLAIDLEIPGYLALPAIQTIAALAAIALERVLPYRRDWLRSHGDLRTDIAHLLFSTNLTLALRWLVIAAVIAIAGTRDIGFDVWPSQWPLVAQLGVLLIVHSVVGYWVHRLHHQIPLLWRLHAIHHSAPRVYWLNQWRVHPVEGLIDGLALVPAVLLGVPEAVLLVFVAIDAVHLILQHANIDLRLGPFGRILSMSEAHRWHHSRIPSEADGNYGGVVLIWDHVFGTYVDPPDRDAPDAAGIQRPFPTGYLGQLAAPFKRGIYR